jgi:hypothetical protein
MDPIRQIEQLIDVHHKNCSALKYKRGTALLYALRIFEDACRLGGISETGVGGDSLDQSLLIREQLNSLRTSINWIYEECYYDPKEPIDYVLDESKCYEFAELHFDYAKPYYILCGAYIGYSRGRSDAQYFENSKKIVFSKDENETSIYVTDVLETISSDSTPDMTWSESQRIHLQKLELMKSIYTIDGHIHYRVTDEIWEAFCFLMQRQWDCSSELPLEWEFDNFTLKGFRAFWINLATFCLIHMFACLVSNIPGAAAEDAVVLKTKDEFYKILRIRSKLTNKEFETIFNFLTYDHRIKNNDVILQPFVPISSDVFALAPHLLLSSRPERNLITLIHKMKDRLYFALTNQREQLIQNLLEQYVVANNTLRIVTNRMLTNELPDIDYAMYDVSSQSVLLCELKWLVEPDSAQEVAAREEELFHGCQQINRVTNYANTNPAQFMNLVFGEKTSAEYKFIPCVISKKGIRVRSNPVPVISLSTFLSFYKNKQSVYTFFEQIKSRAFLAAEQKEFDSYGHETIQYAGYTFELPALIKNRRGIFGNKRAILKVGRNELCPCESKKKYKKCCGVAK